MQSTKKENSLMTLITEICNNTAEIHDITIVKKNIRSKEYFKFHSYIFYEYSCEN